MRGIQISESLIFGMVIVILMFVKESEEEPKKYSLEDPKLCSPITKRKVRYETVYVDQGRSIVHHPLVWIIPNICRFEVQSVYPKGQGGVIAVIQKLNLRRNLTSGECIDYIQFHAKKGSISQRYCGSFDATDVMRHYSDSFHDERTISYRNSFVDDDGEMDVVIFIAKEPLNHNEKTEFSIVFTSFRDCFEKFHKKHVTLSECIPNYNDVCINKILFGDGIINCPYLGCVDENGCVAPEKGDSNIGRNIIFASVSAFAIIFGVFILLIWAFKKHKLFCWADNFAYPTPTPEHNRNSRIVEMNEQTGARLAESPTSQPSAPVAEQDKDLPPSYDSLFPDVR